MIDRTDDEITLAKPKGRMAALLEVGLVSTKLGLTSFGGPVAHLGYFHHEYIRRRQWMDERSYADLVALSQFLPGPASSQVGIGIGIMRAGLLGGLIAWLGFTLPSILVLTVFALLLKGYDIGSAGWIHGLKIVAVAIVAQAVIGMGQKLAPDRNRIAIVVIALAVTLSWQTPYSQILLMIAAGAAGWWLYRTEAAEQAPPFQVGISRSLGFLALALLIALFFLPTILAPWGQPEWLDMFSRFYRSGALVFGGGHVVLPLLEQAFVPDGLISRHDFLAGYGAAQAVPGPLFTFASYLGAIMNGVPGALVATAGIFLPAFLLIVAALPFWDTLRSSPNIRGALAGVNAAVVGLLLAALYDPLWTTAIMTRADFVLGVLLFAMLTFWKLPPWTVVLVGAAAGVFIVH